MTEQHPRQPAPSSDTSPATSSPSGASAGAMLRAAREAQGMHIAALAAAIKVSPRKLEALEADRYGELLDATFARALAQTICRHLKLDAQAVLALMPTGGAVALEPASRIHSTALREEKRGTEREARALGGVSPLFWLAGLLLLAAAAVYLLPAGWWSPAASPGKVATAPMAAPVAGSPPASTGSSAETASQAMPTWAAPLVVADPASSAASAAGTGAALPQTQPPDAASAAALAGQVVAPGSAGQTETVFAAPPPGSASAPVLSHALVVTTSDASWVEVRDARGQVLLSETVQPGRSVGLDGSLPLRILVGNAAATQLVFKGQPVDVLGRARGNVARFEMQ